MKCSSFAFLFCLIAQVAGAAGEISTLTQKFQADPTDQASPIVEQHLTVYALEGAEVYFSDIVLPNFKGDSTRTPETALGGVRNQLRTNYPGVPFVAWLSKVVEKRELCFQIILGHTGTGLNLGAIALELDQDRKKRDLPPTSCFATFPKKSI